MRVVPIDPPQVEPLTAQEAKLRLNIGDDEVSDDVLDAFITAARQQIDGWDGWLGRSLITQSWRLTLDFFPCDEIRIPLPPLQDIIGINYVDSNGRPIDLDPSEYQILQGGRPIVRPAFGKCWPHTRDQPDAVTIEFTAGYGDNPEDVPEPIRCAILLQVGYLRSMTARNLFISSESTTDIETVSYVVGSGAGGVTERAIVDLLRPYHLII